MDYEFKGYAVDQDPTAKALRFEEIAAYMDKLKWFEENSMKPVFISERSQ